MKVSIARTLPEPPRMSARPPVKEPHGSLRWVRNVLSRSIRLEHKRGAGAAAAAEPHAQDDAAPLPLLLQQRAELGARLLVHDPATQPVRHLFLVHDQLSGAGWVGVEALPLPVLVRALTEAEHLASDEPSSLLDTIIERLKGLLAAADSSGGPDTERAPVSDWSVPRSPEVSETNYDEYELMERSWIGTVPAGLDLSGTSPGRL